MTPSIRAALALLLCSALAACASVVPSSPPPADAPPVLLISIDGFRSDYLDRRLTPNLSRLAEQGVRGEGMTPSYPALTFPNHYTLVTGLRPDRHGVVHNTMHDAQLGDFKASDERDASDPRWWNGAEPIWVTAERAGVHAATMFWPGSQAPIRGVRPTHWRSYDASVSNDARVDEVVSWLAQPTPRIRFATLYFELLDKTGHAYGPDSPEMQHDIVAIDAAIGHLVHVLDVRGLHDTNIVIVSDHGMAEVAPGHVVAIEDMVDAEDVDVVSTGQVIGFAPRRGHSRAAETRLLGRHDHYACWKKDALPARWHFGAHPRVPPIVCQMDEGWDAISRSEIAKRPAHARGSHGYDPALPSMRALFIARGPAFRAGARLPVFDNVDVYPLLAKLIGVPPLPNDGTLDPLQPALK
ncbi:MAG TPA: ectonucleotide pyrophosphatase/phosphodiesterase [Lysobacter sp.]|nr:ectonucleotide pyrophosphatase/phosphodiesterase [Lysobacter sp.]